ncbi:MAG TPA: right-handed parallel beta-helix repeat-containing protein, partial [Thermomicrobiaceae bacterium]|nr:right-handed parallel beta-helix repeat-containing protein [Thermomicrobiaceae bacterium]
MRARTRPFRFSRLLVSGVVGLLIAMVFPAVGSAAPAYTVCQSGCPYSDIASAVNAAPDGGTVTVGPGTYVTGQILISKGLTLRGAGKNSTTVSGNGVDSYPAGTILIRDNTGPVTISGFTFTNPILDDPDYGDWMSISAFPATAPVTFTNNRFIGLGLTNNPGDNGIYVAPQVVTATTIIESNEFEKMFRAVLIETATAPVTVRDNVIHDLADTPGGSFTYSPESVVFLAHSGYSDTQPIVVEGNRFYGYGGLDVGVEGGYASLGQGGFTNIQITNNQ